VSGACQCNGNLVQCPDGCVDLSTSNTDCGSCGKSCKNGTCTSGVCVCGQGLVICPDGCDNLSTSKQDCGACGHACANNQTCVSGQCL
jgi:hypothetical protein